MQPQTTKVQPKSQAAKTAKEPKLSPVGRLLRRWRTARGLSQLDLALEAEISARHLSFVETGRSEPSREMILLLGEALDLPLRDRNALLEAGGFAHIYRETDLSDPEMAQVRRVLDFLLERHLPYPAAVIDRHYNVIIHNEATVRLVLAFLDDPSALEGEPNLLRMTFDPKALRPYILNWEEVARSVLGRLMREAGSRRAEAKKNALIAELLAYPDVPEAIAAQDFGSPPDLLLPLHLRKDGLDLKLFTTVTVVGTPQDITLQELRIESLLPADEDSDRTLVAIGSGG